MAIVAPAFYLSHGSPMRVLETSPARTFLEDLGQEYKMPKAIVVVSPHWETRGVRFTSQIALQTIHDFWGFPDALFAIQYPGKNPEWLQELVATDLLNAGQDVISENRGLDHGAWSILRLMYPDAEVPVIGLSLPMDYSFAQLYEFGQKLKSLRQQNIMVLTTGMTTHNLSLFTRRGDQTPDDWAVEFVDWVKEKVANHDLDALFNYRHQAPWAEVSHPRDEHFRPLFIAMGAGEGSDAKLIHDSWELKNGNNASWAWQ